MMKRLTPYLIKYGFSFAFVGLVAWFYISQRDFQGAELVNKYRMICDALTIPGVLLVLFGAMLWVTGQGALDGIAYCIRFAVFSLIPGKRLERDEKYVDYVIRKRENRKKGYSFLFYSGLVTLAAAGVFMYLFYSIY